MNKAKILVCFVIAAMALTACGVEDNANPDPTINMPDSVNVDNPFESETNQPAYAPEV